MTENRDLPDEAARDLLLATIALKYTQSNSITIATGGQLVGVGCGQQSRIHCVQLAANKAQLWHLRRSPLVQALPFREGIGRPERDNAIDLYLRDEMTPKEREAWLASFAQEPAPLSAEERESWLARLQGMSLCSDAFIPFRDTDRPLGGGRGRLHRADGRLDPRRRGDRGGERVRAADDLHRRAPVHALARRETSSGVSSERDPSTRSAAASASGRGGKTGLGIAIDQHAGTVRREDAVGRVFDCRGASGRDADSPQRFEIDVRRRLTVPDLLGGDGRLEAAGDPGQLEHEVDDRPVRGGSQSRAGSRSAMRRTASTAPSSSGRWRR